jgi:DNA-binding transcriptional ArsR family regulator
MYTLDKDLPVKRLQLDSATGKLVEAPKKELFLRGPIPLDWLAAAAKLPGKTLNVAVALYWRHGMAKAKSFKLTQVALTAMNLERDAASAGLTRLEQAGLIRVERRPGQRPIVSILDLPKR